MNLKSFPLISHSVTFYQILAVCSSFILLSTLPAFLPPLPPRQLHNACVVIPVSLHPKGRLSPYLLPSSSLLFISSYRTFRSSQNTCERESSLPPLQMRSEGEWEWEGEGGWRKVEKERYYIWGAKAARCHGVNSASLVFEIVVDKDIQHEWEELITAPRHIKT